MADRWGVSDATERVGMGRSLTALVAGLVRAHPSVTVLDIEALMQKVRAGGKGNFGPIPMAPNPPEKINDADLKEAVEYILKN